MVVASLMLMILMGRRKRKIIEFEQVAILDVASEGKSVARVEEMVIFVKGAIPGDVVDLRVTKKRKNFMEAMPTKFHQYSEDRITPFCQHFGLCGGCKWQQLSYEKQLFYKHKQVNDALSRIAKVPLPEVLPILPSAETQFYRNKLEFTFTDRRWLTEEEIKGGGEMERRGVGFHIPGKFDKVLDLETCYLQNDLSNAIRDGLKRFGKEQDVPFFNLLDKQGFLRNVVIRTANTGDTMVILIVGDDDQELIEKAMAFLQEEFPQITSLYYIINTKLNDSYGDLTPVHIAGEPFITETMEDLKFQVGPKSFYQTNSTQAYELYKVARDFAQLSGDEVVYDLYTGIGTIAQFVAKQAKEVIGIEYVEAAIEDAKVNAELNELTNTRFYAGDMRKVLNKGFAKSHPAPDVVITDPPRAGMHENVIDMLLELDAPRIVYVSCNPATQARDIQLLASKYAVKKIQPVDMFPQTHHVENVVLLEKH